MIIKYWTSFSKRKNSTKRPSGGTEINVSLKENTSIESPVFVLRNENAFEMVYIQAFNHFYFVSDVVNVDNYMSEVHCKQDVLATYKSEIYSYGGYIEYAAEGYDPMVMDTRCQMFEPVFYAGDAQSIKDFPNMNQDGMYVLTVLSHTASPSDFTTTYLVTPPNLKTLVGELLDTTLDWESLIKITNDPITSIIKLIWIPFIFQDGDFVAGQQKESIWIADFESTAKGLKLSRSSNYKHEGDITLTIPWHYNDFRRYQPYTTLGMWVPFYGNIEIPTAHYVNTTTLSIQYSLDVFTGDVTIAVGKTVDDYRQILNYNCAVDCPVSQILANTPAILSDITALSGSVLGAAGSFATGNAIAGVGNVIGAGAAAINMALDAQRSTKSVKGSINGRSMAFFPRQFILYSEYYTTSDPDQSAFSIGRPVNDWHPLANYAGYYIKCDGASISISGRDSDRDEINSYLNGGFYLE